MIEALIIGGLILIAALGVFGAIWFFVRNQQLDQYQDALHEKEMANLRANDAARQAKVYARPARDKSAIVDVLRGKADN